MTLPNDEIKIPTGLIKKSWIRRVYKLTPNELCDLLHKRYAEKLEAIGYDRKKHSLTPREFEVFRSCFGEP